ncbi:MAG: class I adenylate-forming enzyme family protein [Gammaproteobacteria bacterium]|nr:class I adenylate-forming enzyme family protein [Gammaproteobacteria bacterium]
MSNPDSLPFTETAAGAMRWLSQHHGGSKMVIEEDRVATFSEVDRASADLAKALLSSGVGKGSRIAFLFPNGIDFAKVFFAITRIGAIAIPVNTFYKAPELVWQLNHCDAQMLITIDRFLHNDYLARLDEGLVGLAGQGDEILLESTPYLRKVVVRTTGGQVPAWAEEIEAFTRLGAPVSDSMLRAVESTVVPADHLCVLYTSGSSATPKGVVHSHGALLRRTASVGADFGIGPEDIVYNPSPFFWTGGLSNGLLSTVLNAGAVMTEERFDAPRTLDQLEKHRVTVAVGWPHFAASLRAVPDFSKRDLGALRGGILTPLLLGNELGDPGLTATGIGMTESVAQHTYGEKEPLPESLRGAYGRPAPGIEQMIVDVDTGLAVPDGQEGELCIRGYSVMQGYYKKEREETFRSDGFFATGDLGVIRDGFYFFTGRRGDMVKTGGANVSPAEVRNAMLGIEGVQECFISGLPDPDKGEVVAAAVVVHPQADLTAETVRSELKAVLSSFKVPQVLKLMHPSDIPMLPTDKVDRRAIIGLLQQQAG